MVNTISFRANRRILQDLGRVEQEWCIDRSETIRRLLVKALKSWKVGKVLEELKGHKVSIGKAAELCGISIWEMLELAKQRCIDWTGYSREDLEKDLKILGELN